MKIVSLCVLFSGYFLYLVKFYRTNSWHSAVNLCNYLHPYCNKVGKRYANAECSLLLIQSTSELLCWTWASLNFEQMLKGPKHSTVSRATIDSGGRLLAWKVHHLPVTCGSLMVQDLLKWPKLKLILNKQKQDLFFFSFICGYSLGVGQHRNQYSFWYYKKLNVFFNFCLNSSVSFLMLFFLILWITENKLYTVGYSSKILMHSNTFRDIKLIHEGTE